MTMENFPGFLLAPLEVTGKVLMSSFDGRRLSEMEFLFSALLFIAHSSCFPFGPLSLTA